MHVFVSLVAVVVLGTVAWFGVKAVGLYSVFGMVIPYVAIAIFLLGVIYRILKWAKSPVPFRIPTTCGQQKTHPWIKSNKLDNPSSMLGVIGRMALEVLFFRSLFRNTRMELTDEKKVVYGPTKWLWLAGLAFHWSFLIVFLRHLRFFTEPVPFFVVLLQDLDGFFQVGVPVFYITSVVLLASVTFLFLRRVVIPQVKYISLANDFFPLFLILGIAGTGFFLRHYFKTDIVAVKELALGLVSLKPVVSAGIHPLFFVHLFFVSLLFAYFPFSKLMHFAGVFLSPTRNLANNNRAVRHINPWNYPVKVHTYEEYEDDFREKMVECGLPVDKPLADKE